MEWRRTPGAAVVGALAALWWLSSPLVEFLFYSAELRRGAFPPHADSISIPLYRFALGWLVMTPVYALAVRAGLRRYRGRVSLAAFDRARAARSWIWSVTLVALCAQFLLDAWRALSHGHWGDALHSVLGAYLLLCARSSLCTPPAAGDGGGGDGWAAGALGPRFDAPERG